MYFDGNAFEIEGLLRSLQYQVAVLWKYKVRCLSKNNADISDTTVSACSEEYAENMKLY